MYMIKWLAGLLLTALLASCGGGGGSPGTTSGSQALFTTAPSALTLTLGNAQSFAVGGGRAPYSAVSSDVSTAVAGINGSSLTLGAVSPGTASITIRDALGAATSVSVTAKPTRALFTSAPSSLTIAIGNSSAQTYQVGGGVAPYVVGNSNPSVLSAVLNGSNLTLTGLAPGTALVDVLDGAGAEVTVTVTVPAVATLDLFTTASPGVTLPNGTTATYVVGGGAAPYTATSANTSVATVSLSGTNLAISAIGAGATSINIRDNAGHTVGVSVTVSPGQAFFTTAPSAVTIPAGGAPAFTVGGGVAPYTAVSSNTSIATATLASGTVTITGVASGSANILLRDAAGAVLSVAVTVPAPLALFTTAAPTVTLGVGTPGTYVVGGGTGGYTATSNNTNVATASLSGTSLVITPVATGSATITIRDSSGASTTAGVTVAPATAFFTTAPSAVVLAIHAAPTYTVGGGVGPYTVVSNNTSVATATVTNSGTPTLTINAVAAGNAQVVLRDNSGTLIPIAVTVNSGTTVPLFTSAAPAVTLPNGTTASYTIAGGLPPYVVASANASIATAVTDGSSTLTISALGSGNTTVTVRDSTGTAVPVSVTVAPATSFFTTAPSALSVAVGSNATYQVGGGVAPYTATSNNLAVATAAVTNGAGSAQTLTISGLAVGSAGVTLRDSAGTQINVAVSVTGGSALFTTAPTSVTLSLGSTQSFSVGGGVAPYTVTSSNTSIVRVAGTSPFTLTGIAVGGPANVVIRDAAGTTVNVAVSVVNTLMTLNPSKATTVIGATNYAYILGGVPPYSALSGFPTVATVAVGTLNLSTGVFTPDPMGNVLKIVANQAASPDQVVVTDSVGNSANFELTSAAGTLGIALSPSMVTVASCPAVTIPLTLYGAVGTTYLFSSDTSLATVPVSVSGSASGTTFNVTKLANASGPSVVITAIDSTSAAAISTITIQASSVPCP